MSIQKINFNFGRQNDIHKYELEIINNKGNYNEK